MTRCAQALLSGFWTSFWLVGLKVSTSVSNLALALNSSNLLTLGVKLPPTPSCAWSPLAFQSKYDSNSYADIYCPWHLPSSNGCFLFSLLLLVFYYYYYYLWMCALRLAKCIQSDMCGRLSNMLIPIPTDFCCFHRFYSTLHITSISMFLSSMFKPKWRRDITVTRCAVTIPAFAIWLDECRFTNQNSRTSLTGSFLQLSCSLCPGGYQDDRCWGGWRRGDEDGSGSGWGWG